MKIFVTGSTGMLGINFIEAALARGHEVLALVRDERKARRVLPDDPRVQLVNGDLENLSWLPRLGEAEALMHGAAYFREAFGRGDHQAKLHQLNVEVPRRLVLAAAEEGLKRSLVVSSSGVISPRDDGQAADESSPANGALPESDYFMSKVAMEEALKALKLPNEHQLVMVRPGWMFGPNDYAPTNAGQLILDLLKRGSLQLVGGTPMCIADARDVAQAIVTALETPQPAPVYNLAGLPQTAIDALREIARQAGKAKVQQVPLPLALALSAVLELPARWRGQQNPIPRVGLLTIARGVLVSSEKAERELGATFRPFRETAHDTLAFVRRELFAQTN